MMRPSELFRLVSIIRVLQHFGIDEFAAGTRAERSLRVARWCLGSGPLRKAGRPRGERVREALQELGPIFVKFGQTLSTRRDLLPPDVADELARLQDNVPPFASATARAELEKIYRRPLEEIFAEFDDQPLAAASIAQCHGACLPEGQEVVVKVLRPGVRNQIRRDLDLMYALARIVTRLWPESRRLRPVDVVAEYEKIIIDELDLMR